MKEQMSEILQYKLRIKEWEKNFASKNGRLPTKVDVKADAEIRKAYKVYNAMKKEEGAIRSDSGPGPNNLGNLDKHSLKKVSAKNPIGSSEQMRNSPKSLGSSKIRLPPTSGSKSGLNDDGSDAKKHHIKSVDLQLTDDEDYEPLVPVFNAELGPTPQANGKVLSIFDMIPSPPESSPIKKSKLKLKVFDPLDSTSPFKTPTKSVKRINLEDVTPVSSLSLTEKLRQVAETPKSMAKNDILETPRYLGKVNNKFSFSEHESTPSHSRSFAFTTPTKPVSVESFQVSPSPLKSQRFLQSRLSEIYLAHKNLATDEEFEAQKIEFEKEFEILEEPETEETPTMEHLRDMKRRKKPTTQKRTTRRWKIKPRGEGDQNDPLEGKDIHEEMQRLDSENHPGLDKDEASSDEVTSEDEKPVVRKAPPSTKINAISNNYQRLKINDPRAKKFKQRMRRR